MFMDLRLRGARLPSPLWGESLVLAHLSSAFPSVPAAQKTWAASAHQTTARTTLLPAERKRSGEDLIHILTYLWVFMTQSRWKLSSYAGETEVYGTSAKNMFTSESDLDVLCTSCATPASFYFLTSSSFLSSLPPSLLSFVGYEVSRASFRTLLFFADVSFFTQARLIRLIYKAARRAADATKKPQQTPNRKTEKQKN